jgi:hypothetical protein
VIVRSNEYMNRFRGFNLYLNGKKLGDIFNNEKEEFEIPEGDHQLVAKIDWCSSPAINFNVTGNDVQTFNVSGFKHNKVVLPMSAALAILHLVLRYFFHIQLSIFFILPLLLLLVFYISIGRKQYLTLESREHEGAFSAERVK